MTIVKTAAMKQGVYIINSTRKSTAFQPAKPLETIYSIKVKELSRLSLHDAS